MESVTKEVQDEIVKIAQERVAARKKQEEEAAKKLKAKQEALDEFNSWTKTKKEKQRANTCECWKYGANREAVGGDGIAWFCDECGEFIGFRCDRYGRFGHAINPGWCGPTGGGCC